MKYKILITICLILTLINAYLIFQAYQAADSFDFEYANILKEKQAKVVEPPVEEYNEMTTEDIKEYIIRAARFYEVDPNLALKIAECESQFKNVCNYQYGCIAGIGIYQIVMGTFRETIERMVIERGGIFLTTFPDEGIAVHFSNSSPVIFSPHNIQDNINAAIWMMSEGEFWRWSQSEKCWR